MRRFLTADERGKERTYVSVAGLMIVELSVYIPIHAFT